MIFRKKGPPPIKRFSLKRRSQKSGLPPGTPVLIGDSDARPVHISVITYTSTEIEEKSITDPAESSDWRQKPGITWINVDGIHDLSILEKIGASFDLHPLVREDIVNTDQRPKIEDYETYLYIVIRMLHFDEKQDRVLSEQLSLVLGEGFVLTFQENREDELNTIRERIRQARGRVRNMPADYLAYAIMDSVVDHYFNILEKIGERIETIEEELMGEPETGILRKIHQLKHEMILLRKSIWPLREVVNVLQRNESERMHESTLLYLRDLYDHTIQIIDTIETYRDVLSGMLDVYLSTNSNRLNSVMKVLTMIATIFIPLTFLVGVYGMNFKYMPELDSHWGYPAVWFANIATAGTMLYYFYKKKWF